ncbi:MAG: hypothetical protein CBC23_007880 [Rhodospirillaceae bacterium TMED63]|nr:hypothetical protein [Rhodospirillaceae bacterium]RPF98824.1 MAG: hypothetical protein CBC23_007880 [Rhodospirillaceae bacterium TMED63]
MGEIKAGEAEIKKDGRAYYNDQELATRAQNEIARAGREQRKGAAAVSIAAPCAIPYVRLAR